MTKVLLVSNDAQLKKNMEVILGHTGFVVHTSSTSSEGWGHLKEIRFDVLMIDSCLRDESGLAFFKALRQFGASLPVLMIGECAFDEFMLSDMSEENFDFAIKPLKFETLKDKMNRLLERSSEKFHTPIHLNERLTSLYPQTNMRA